MLTARDGRAVPLGHAALLAGPGAALHVGLPVGPLP